MGPWLRKWLLDPGLRKWLLDPGWRKWLLGSGPRKWLLDPGLCGEIGTANPAFAVPNPFCELNRTADSRFPYGAPAGGRGGVPGGEALTGGCGQEHKATISHSTF